MAELLEYLQKEGAVIFDAPLIFLTVLAMLSAIIWFAVRHQFSERIESLNARLQLRDDRIADYEAKLKVASPEDAAKLIDKLEGRIKALEPEHFTDDQAQAAIEKLRSFRGSINIWKDLGSPGASKIYSQAIAVFRDAGWQVNEGAMMGIGDPPRSGVAIYTTTGVIDSDEARSVSAALKAGGLKYDLRQMPSLPEPRPTVGLLFTTAA